MTDEILQEINHNLQKLLGVISTQGMSDEKKIIILQRMKFNSSEISEMTGIPVPTVKSKWVKKNKKK
jgi:DNA-directed RNA polymerase specialized sigma24 family protein